MESRLLRWGAGLGGVVLWAGLTAAQTLPAQLQKLRPTVPLQPARSTLQAPDEFGTTDYEVTVIPAASFTADSFFAYVTDYGSLARYFPFDSEHHHYLAGLSQIPSGAVIDTIGLECASSAPGELTAELWYVDDYSGTTSGIVVLQNTPHGFDTDYTADPVGWQLAANVHNALVLDVDQAPNSEPLFGWVEIWWKRTVSPPPSTATFPDVPTDHPFFQFVEALHAAGITGGYGNGNFGVNDPVTRGQMAVFLAKALGLHWPY